MTAAEILPGQYDQAILGAGSAGCMLANRLSADPGISVLLQAGGSGAHPYVRTPAGFPKAFRGSALHLVLQHGAGARRRRARHLLPARQVLGGSSSTNGLFMRVARRAKGRHSPA
jgi:choline dehydrogenase